MKHLLEGLNPEQLAAVTHPEGPLLVLAGAGSGKTRVLTLRIAWLIEELGVSPWRILALTFTNKAAKEMKERVGNFLGPSGNDAWVSTFHSTCLRILRREIDLLPGFSSGFVIYDAGDSKNLVKQILVDLKAPKTVNQRAISSAIDRAKNDAMGPSELEANLPATADPRTAEVYRQYQRRLQAANALDFGDLIVKTIELFDQQPAVLERYRQRFSHVLVDEYQDTNPAQYRLMRQLTDHGDRSVCVVGDEDQSIYSFRGADIRNILDFESDYPGARTIRLERNYRSTQLILEAATAVVEHNEERKGKRLWTDQEGGDRIVLHLAFDDREEARAAVQIARREIAGGLKPRDLAVFYRTNGQSRLVEEEFLSARLPFVLIGGQRFYERREIKDALSYLKLVANPRDDMALMRVINEPPRGIGAKTRGQITSHAVHRGFSYWEAIEDLCRDDSTLQSRARKALTGFRDLVDTLRVGVGTRSVADLLESIYDKTGMVDRLQEDGSFEAGGRLSNLEELYGSTQEYDSADPRQGLIDFLDRVALVADTDQLPEGENDDGQITLMTVHASKGLEFPAVIVIGMDEGLFPHARASTFQHELEEERRLCYVAITRAERRLYLLRARRRPAQGKMRGQGYMATEPSRFLRHIPRDLLTGDSSVEPSPGAMPRRAPRPSTERWIDYSDAGTPPSRFARPDRPGRASTVKTGLFSQAPAPPTQPGLFSAPTAEPDEDDAFEEPRVVHDEPDEAGAMLAVGTRVLHPTFGEGEIRVLEGRQDNLRATIHFRRAGPKRVYLRYAELEILGR